MKTLPFLTTILISLASFAQTNATFPKLVGHDLNGSPVSLPVIGAKKFTVVGICYKRDAETDLKTWIQPMYDVFVAKPNDTDYFDVASYLDVNYYFIPLISGFKKAANDFKAQTQPELWKNVIDCDTDLKTLKTQLKPSDENIPYFYVIDLDGKIIKVVSGKCTDSKMDELEDAID